MNKSYHAGHNGFTLTLGDVVPLYLCSDLEGDARRPLEVTVHGSVDYGFGSRSHHAVLKVFGDCGSELGLECVDCRFEVYGSVGDACGSGAKDSLFFIETDVGANLTYGSNTLARTINCSFYIGKSVKSIGNFAKSCKFIVQDKGTFQFLKNIVDNPSYVGINEVLLKKWQSQH